ncbi:MAG: TIGR02217 family protein, partial [Qipengyuania vulgaris]
MAFWLASKRRQQHSDWIQRFDPRFWTVNFPRPMMASVVTTSHDALRVDCEFLHNGELAGLIWESEDTLDHPLLAYATQRDYAHCVLSFRWRSSGLVALDQPHGPTLTIEGRDASGTARSWYVRLWNYASGSPTDAVIELPFSQLQAGYGLPGEAIPPSDIDRLFISLMPTGYAEGGTTQFTHATTGWAEVSEMLCYGDRSMLEIGDVLIPPHGEQIATAYDDSFNQTPARLIRSIEGLGYRGRFVHYVGMSHYFRLAPFNGGHNIDQSGVLCEPARAWHENFFAEAVARDLAPIVSLSFEILAQHCPAWWRQRAWDNSSALTGWDPPSSLLSPANGGAQVFLQSIAVQFVALLEAAGGAPSFQIGEPWWWVIPETGQPCFYDKATKNSQGADLVEISDMRAPMSAEQIAFLDRMGALLADATDGLAQAIRDAAQGDAEILLLAFTPTVYDHDMPELHRANMPVGWAYPAFDRLQLEDYDWLTAGADSSRRAAIAAVDQKLGYPVEMQDYFAGFVLRADDAHVYWPLIDRALDEARARGVSQRFVWALPQVARDGYTRLPTYEEDDMNAFDDVAYPLALGRDASVSPEFS